MGTAALPQLIAAAPSGARVGYDQIEQAISGAPWRRRSARTIERPEIYGRLQPGVVVFDMLRPQHVAEITRRLIGQLTESVQERHGVCLEVDTDAVLAWVEGEMKDPEKLSLGGRQIRNEMEAVRAAYVRYYVTDQPAAGAVVRLGVDPAGGFTVAAVAAGDA